MSKLRHLLPILVSQLKSSKPQGNRKESMTEIRWRWKFDRMRYGPLSFQSCQGILRTCIDWSIFDWLEGAISETAIIKSPDSTMPRAFKSEKVWRRLISISSEKSMRKGISPHLRFSFILTSLESVNVKIGQSGRFLDNRDAISPSLVKTKIASALSLFAASRKGRKAREKAQKIPSNYKKN